MELDNCIFSRRSIRKFKKQKVEKTKLIKIIEAGRWAPSGGNAQPWKIIVVRNPDVIDKMRSSIRSQIHQNKEKKANLFRNLKFGTFFNAPIIIAVCVNLKSSECFLKNSNFSTVDKLIDNTEIISTGAAIQNMLLKIHDLGLGACWCRIDYYKREALENCLNIRDPYTLIANIAVGYPAENPQVKRKKLSEISAFIG